MRRGLGQGLDALFAKTAINEEESLQNQQGEVKNQPCRAEKRPAEKEF